MEYFYEGSPDSVIDQSRAGELLDALLAQLGDLWRVLLLPPDFTRAHSWAGELTVMLYERLKDKAHLEIMPAIGTHFPMTDGELDAMFPGLPHDVFRAHDWRGSLVHLGEVPADFIRETTDGKLEFPVFCEINRLLVEGAWDRIISIGQLVPHEVSGIANHNKNVFVGTGGVDTINKTHYIGAVCNMERIMGREKSPVREVLNYMAEHVAKRLPIAYVMTVRAKDASGRLVTRGLYAGDDNACFLRGAKLCQEVNLDLLDAPLRKTIVYLDPAEFKSTWLGNKAIYRTRMAMADGGELVILAPGVREFGEDKEIDRLIRKYGYRGTPHILRMVEQNEDLAANLAAAAHLIHGSSEGRFQIIYCPGDLTREEIEGVGFEYADLGEITKRYNPERLRNGFNRMPDGEEVFYIANPALGLWGLKSQFEK
ncbi:D-mannonate epimerase [candidate division BRC1 bacterium SM23_51]|nr:MAG: D-mannonate epimerase [candidate division BRC1 bacterium SM23_51]